ncbi:MAG: hypothetical protein A2070_14380 [Bdellovibrionales bacterium GWC1_52_8]|nr:MAG: hypothetical protein A2Z97_03225 [Bdellovibrionales bacterium GWB1_52_6]OFZ02884.1 MAG: hypothetical protein A2X97_04750 [Bdellovibrionales bacterium GWA1_52_35]OFZ33763.1 MAG: hypothetical protein A2070_14380 [Bdellovibrionales bacterium GWC1_52_8]HCM38467.1 hypothetical protein [Bdellovibrionales bacterium]
MKFFVAGIFGFMGLMLSCSGAVFAAEGDVAKRVVLDSNKVSIDTDKAILVRTASTPRSIKVYMNIPFGRTYCSRYETRTVWGPDSSCGYYTECNLVCSNYCQVWNSHGGCVAWGQECYNRCHEYMNSCYHPQVYCAETGVAYKEKQASFKLTFKKASRLGPNEEETFEVIGSQKTVDGRDDVYTLRALDTKTRYLIKNSWFFGDWVSVKGNQ